MRGSFAIAPAFALLAGCGLARNGLFSEDAGTGEPTKPGSPDATVATPLTEDASSSDDATASSDVSTPEDTTEDAATAGSIDAGSAVDACPPLGDASITVVTQISPPPTINGDLSDWGCGPWVELNATNAAHVLDGGQAISGQYAARWDATNLYIAAHIVVPMLQGDNMTTPYENDAIEFYLSGDSPISGDYDKQSHQYIVDWHNLAVDYASLHYPPSKATTSPPNFASQVRIVPDGWQIEAAIGWQALVNGGTAPASIGFDVQFDDGDGTILKTLVLAMIAPHSSTCGCASCCCGQAADLPDCDTLCFEGVTLE